MKRIFCDLCGEPAIEELVRTFNPTDGRTEYISVRLEIYFRESVTSTWRGPSSDAGICSECLKELLEPLSVSHTDDVKTPDERCSAKMLQCDYNKGHKGAHRASQSNNHPTEVMWDSTP